jgi:tripartite-type tricarboxylate transporter receptor subunit TctC
MKRAFIAASLAAGFILGGLQMASAEWPNDRPIRLIVGFGAGGGTDIAARIIADPLGKLLHQSIVVENKPGAGGSIASGEVARAAKDGYTATMISTGHTVGAAMLKSVPYDAVNDFAPVAVVANSAFVVVVNKDFKADDLKGLIALAKASPGKLNFASVGVGSTQHLAGELLVQMAGISVKHIPYRGSPALIAALLANQIDFGVETFLAVQGQVQAGKLKVLAVGSPARLANAPNIPTVAESGVPGYAVTGWYGWVYPAGVPQAIVDKTNAALKAVLAMPDVREKLAKVGAIATISTPAEFRTLLTEEVAKWKAVRDKAGLTAQ